MNGTLPPRPVVNAWAICEPRYWDWPTWSGNTGLLGVTCAPTEVSDPMPTGSQAARALMYSGGRRAAVVAVAAAAQDSTGTHPNRRNAGHGGTPKIDRSRSRLSGRAPYPGGTRV